MKFVVRFRKEQQHFHSKSRCGAVESSRRMRRDGCCGRGQESRDQNFSAAKLLPSKCALHVAEQLPRLLRVLLDQHHDNSIPAAAILATALSTCQYDVHTLQPTVFLCSTSNKTRMYFSTQRLSVSQTTASRLPAFLCISLPLRNHDVRHLDFDRNARARLEVLSADGMSFGSRRLTQFDL